MEQHRGRAIGDYITVQEIGAGSFAVVWKARHRVTGHEVAIKEIATEKLNKKLQESLLSEINILQKANHPNIIRLHDIVKASDRIYLILEYCAGGDLAGYISRHGKVPEATARNFMQQLGCGLQVLRKNNLIHRDLKPQNLLLSTKEQSPVLKIADFGFARSLQPQGMAETLCGSPLYMAPEILQCQKYDAKADLWSVGAILFQLVTGEPPYSGNSHNQLLSNIQKYDVHFSNSRQQLHPDCIDVCRKLLRRNPVERLSFEEFFNHPFMRPTSSRPPPVSSSYEADSGEVHHEECLPFLLDDDGPGAMEVPVKPLTRFNHGSKPSPTGLRHSEFEDPGTENLYSNAGDPDGVLTSSPRTALLDSMECIEREYVVVKPFTSGDLSLSASTIDQHASKGGSPHKKPPSPVMHAPPTATISRVSTPPNVSPLDTGEETSEGRYLHPSTRLSSLQRCARLVAELATDKFDAGEKLDSLSVQLVCLAIWKEALNVAVTIDQAGARGQDPNPTSVYPQVEQEFSAAVDRGEQLASHLTNLDDGMEMPDATETIFQAALTIGRTGAVEELMGNFGDASVAYAKAVGFLYFILFEGPSLQLNPPLVLTPADRQRLRKYADMINGRLSVCSAEMPRPSSSLE